ncbi:MAG: ATP-binding protein [Pelagimonas sp.]|jgi:PAS domain S-box-containing protein|nr:ATP-binding protein [Pelagimonas sp.]
MTKTMPNADLAPSNTYGAGLERALHQSADILSVGALIGLIIGLLRLESSSWMMVALLVIFTVCAILPALVLRARRFLRLRIGLIVAGYLQGLTYPIATQGIADSGVIYLPMLVAMTAAVFERRVTFALLAGIICFLMCVSVMYVLGIFQAPDLPLRDWAARTEIWVTLVFSVAIPALVLALLLHGMRKSWQNTSNEAAEKYDQFEKMVEYAPNAITIFDLDLGRFVAVNTPAERLFGVDRATLLGQGSVTNMSPERQPCGTSSDVLARKYLQQALDGEHPVFRWNHLHSDGREIPCEVSLVRIPPDSKRLVRGSIRNITRQLEEQADKEELQYRLAASQRLEAIGHLTGGVAHDFNNLLAIVLGNLELLQDEITSERQKELLQPTIEATLRGASLTKSMLSFARRAPLDPVIVDMNKLVRDTKNWTSRTLPTNMVIETSLLAGLWSVQADPGATENALINLILNARDAMPNGGDLTIETANVRIDEAYIDSRQEELEPGRYVMVAVSDTGVGIDQDTLENIFVPFFTTKETGRGSGLGLSMVQGFMRQSGGTIQVYSEPGVGTTFKLYFPATDAPPDPAMTAQPAPLSSGEKRILLSEDEDDVRTVLTAMLGAAGYHVVSAASGDAAIEIFETDRNFDLLLTDIVMPGQLQGTGLAKAIRAKAPELPVIFMSGYAAEATVHGNGLRPSDIRLMKPVMRRDLLEAVTTMLDDSRT